MLDAGIDILKQLGAWSAILVIIAITVARVLWSEFTNRS